MWLNSVIFLGIALLTYGLTVYFNHQSPAVPSVIVQLESVVESLPEGEALPDFSFQTPEGMTYRGSDFKGKVILLNFWASWCPPCVKEFPALIEIAQAFPDDVVLIALSSDIEESGMRAFIKKQGTLPKNVFVAFDKDQAVTQKIFQTFQLPETIVIDKAQNMRHKIAGADWKIADLKKQIVAYR